jgi:hypothetical protein
MAKRSKGLVLNQLKETLQRQAYTWVDGIITENHLSGAYPDDRVIKKILDKKIEEIVSDETLIESLYMVRE